MLFAQHLSGSKEVLRGRARWLLSDRPWDVAATLRLTLGAHSHILKKWSARRLGLSCYQVLLHLAVFLLGDTGNIGGLNTLGIEGRELLVAACWPIAHKVLGLRDWVSIGLGRAQDIS
jgi:hypothetical protein